MVQCEESYFGECMSWSTRARVVIVGVLSALVSLSVFGQGLPSGVTQGMLDELRSMSPAQQEAFARQYAKEFQAEMEAPINELVTQRTSDPLRGEIGQDLKSKIQSGEIKIM